MVSQSLFALSIFRRRHGNDRAVPIEQSLPATTTGAGLAIKSECTLHPALFEYSIPTLVTRQGWATIHNNYRTEQCLYSSIFGQVLAHSQRANAHFRAKGIIN